MITYQYMTDQLAMLVKSTREAGGDSPATKLLFSFQSQLWKVDLNVAVVESYNDSISLHTNYKIVSDYC